MTQPAKRFPAPAIDTLPEDIRTRILAVQEKSRLRAERVPDAGATGRTSSAPSSPITTR